MTNKVLSNAMAVFILRGATFGVRVVCMLSLARYTPVEVFGTISLLMSIAEIGRVIADAGVDTFMMRVMASSSPEFVSRNIGGALAVKLLLGVLTAIAVYVVGARFNPNYIGLTLAFSVMAVSPLLLSLASNLYIANQQAGRATPLIMVGGLTAVVLFAYVLHTTGSASRAIFVIPIFELTVGVWLLFRGAREFSLQLGLLWGQGILVAKGALSLGIANVLGFAYGRIDVFVLQSCCGSRVLAQYSFWSRVVDPFLFVCGVISITAYGHLSRAYVENERADFRPAQRRYFALSIALSTSVAVLASIVPQLGANWLPPAYASATWIVQSLGILLVVRAISLILTASLLASGKRLAVMYAAAWNTGSQLLLMPILAKSFGATGVIVSLFVVELINLTVQSAVLIRADLMPFRFSKRPA